MSLFVFAGSAQLAALPLIAAGAPLWVLWATAFCVNLRFVIFSAHWREYFGHLPRVQRLVLGYFAADLSYVLFLRRFPEPNPLPEQLPYFCGSASWNWLSWQIPSLLGIVLADRVPTDWGLGFAGVLALLGITYSTAFGRTAGSRRASPRARPSRRSACRSGSTSSSRLPPASRSGCCSTALARCGDGAA